jgi:hypothetical protein
MDASVTLKKLSDKCAELRDTELEIQNLSERLAALNTKKYKIEREELPELMSEAGVDKIGVPASGNQPAYDLKMVPFYSANIAAGWEPERRAASYAYLEKHKAGDLIKTQIIINLPREERKKAKALIKQLKKWKPEVKESIHSGTLTAWLREKTEAGEDVNLEMIGGQVGQIVKPKARKETL